MILEFNLVKTPTIDSTYGQLIMRSRTPVENETEALQVMLTKIQENFEFIEGAISDKDLATRISSLQSITINELFELKYYLNYFGGIDIWFWYVNDMEIGKDGIDDGMLEYTVIDKTSIQSLFIPMIQRFNMEQDTMQLSKMFTKVAEITGVFDSTLSEGMINPIKNQIDSIIPAESAQGSISNVLTHNINAIFNYMGKSIVTIVG